MCNLYRRSSSRTEIAPFFDAVADGLEVNTPEEIFPCHPRRVLARGQVRQTVWGFPLQRTGVKGQSLKPKPINNARADKLLGSFWQPSYRARCLIPLTAFAELEGE
jgi:putative SOS response-associated peptidase YedK